MFGKFLLIALVCVSFAQVHGDLLENAINRGLLRARGMNENAKERLSQANRNVDDTQQLISFRTGQFLEKASRVQEYSRQALRSVGFSMEKMAKEHNRPPSVIECIGRNERKGNTEIISYIRKFITDIERLKGTKLDNVNTAAEAYNGLGDALKERYLRATTEMVKCENLVCVNTVFGSYSTYLNSFYATIRRVEGQINTILTNFQRDANNYFTNSNRQISRIRSASIQNIRNCYFRRGYDFLISEESQELQEF